MAVIFHAPNTTILNGMIGLTDCDADTFILTLHNGYTFDATDDEYTDVSATEIATGFGYTQQNEALTSVTAGQTGGTFVFDAANVTWPASGGTIGPATGSWTYDDTSTNDKLICYIEFGASESAVDGADFNHNWNASGIFTGAFS